MAAEERKKIICLVHFNPVELFPPVMNMANFFGSKIEVGGVKIFTTHAPKIAFEFKPDSKISSISRLGWTDQSLSVVRRLLTYLWFNVGVLFWLIVNKPSSIIYCETISSFAPVFYKKYLNKKVKLIIHYHEYMTPDEYKDGMILVRQFNRLERSIYNKADWVSHTNGKRLQLFKDDLGDNYNIVGRVLPNYPPASWSVSCPRGNFCKNHNNPLRVVYLGNLNLEKLYIKEFSEWVVGKNGKVIWDIFSLNNTKETDDFFQTLKSPFINFKGAAAYFELPNILKDYDVGVILYKGLSLNWIYSVPNKLFEYHVCGLDVWVSSEIESAAEFIKEESSPFVKVVDFENLSSMDIDCQKNPAAFKLLPFQIELILGPLWETINC